MSLTRRSSSRLTRRDSSPASCCRWTAGRARGSAAETVLEAVLSFRWILRAVFPVPGFVEVRIETVLLGVLHQPLINLRVDLYRAIPVVRTDGLAADVEVQRASGEMRAVDGQAGAPRPRALFAKLRLIGRRAKRRDDLQPVFV